MKGEEEAERLTFRIRSAGESKGIHVVGIEKGSLEGPFGEYVRAGGIGEFRPEAVAVFDAWGAQEDLYRFEIISLRHECLGERLSWIYFLDVAPLEGQRIGEGDERGESEEYEESGYSEEREENFLGMNLDHNVFFSFPTFRLYKP